MNISNAYLVKFLKLPETIKPTTNNFTYGQLSACEDMIKNSLQSIKKKP